MDVKSYKSSNLDAIAEGNVLKYGEACEDNSLLTVRNTKLGEDVGHYDSVVCPTSASVFITPSMLSPLPNPNGALHQTG